MIANASLLSGFLIAGWLLVSGHVHGFKALGGMVVVTLVLSQTPLMPGLS